MSDLVINPFVAFPLLLDPAVDVWVPAVYEQFNTDDAGAWPGWSAQFSRGSSESVSDGLGKVSATSSTSKGVVMGRGLKLVDKWQQTRVQVKVRLAADHTEPSGTTDLKVCSGMGAGSTIPSSGVREGYNLTIAPLLGAVDLHRRQGVDNGLGNTSTSILIDSGTFTAVGLEEWLNVILVVRNTTVEYAIWPSSESQPALTVVEDDFPAVRDGVYDDESSQVQRVVIIPHGGNGTSDVLSYEFESVTVDKVLGIPFHTALAFYDTPPYDSGTTEAVHGDILDTASTFRDVSGNGNDGKMDAGALLYQRADWSVPVTQQSSFGRIKSWNGGAGLTGLTTDAGFTLSMVLYMRDISPNDNLVNNAGTDIVALRAISGTQLRVTVGATDVTGGTIATGSWYHISVYFSSVTNAAWRYINGVKDTLTATFPSATFDIPNLMTDGDVDFDLAFFSLHEGELTDDELNGIEGFKDAIAARAVYSDSFDRANGPLGANWTVLVGDVQVDNNRAENMVSGAQMARYESPTNTDDMYAEAVCSGTTASSNTWGVFARMSASSTDGYGIVMRDGTSPTNEIVRIDNGSMAQIVDLSAVSFSRGQTLRVEVEGNEIRGYIDGSLVGSTTDNTHTSGKRGGIYGSGADVGRINWDNFETGDLLP